MSQDESFLVIVSRVLNVDCSPFQMQSSLYLLLS